MAEQETRTNAEELEQLNAAKNNALQSLSDLTQNGIGDGRVEAFNKAISEFTNISRLSVVKEGGADLMKILASSSPVKDAVDSALDKAEDSSEISKILGKASDDLLESSVDVLNGTAHSADHMARSFESRGVSPTNLVVSADASQEAGLPRN